MYQNYNYNLSTSKIEGNEVVPVGLTIDVTLEGIFDETECNVIREGEFVALFDPWFKLFEAAPLNRYIQRPIPVNVAIFLATMTNRIVDTHVIRSMQIEVREGSLHSYMIDTRILEDIGVATRGGPWRGHSIESMGELAKRFPEMFSLDEIAGIAEAMRSAKKEMNSTIHQIKARRLKELIKGGGSIIQS